DLGTLLVPDTGVDAPAVLPTQAGAPAIDQGSFYTGTLRLDPQAAKQRCGAPLAAARLQGRCTADVRSITADVSQVVTLPVPLLGVRAPIHVSRTAQPAFGGSTAETTS